MVLHHQEIPRTSVDELTMDFYWSLFFFFFQTTRLYATSHLRVLLRARVPFFHSWGIELLVTQVRGLYVTRTGGAVLIARGFTIVTWVRFFQCPVQAPAPSPAEKLWERGCAFSFLLCFNLKWFEFHPLIPWLGCTCFHALQDNQRNIELTVVK